MFTVYMSLGSNMGNKKQNLDQAIKLLEQDKDIQVVLISTYIETEPVGYTNQDKFLNCAIKIFTDLSPSRLLKRCMEIENELKRVRTVKWGPRTIDIDILMYEDFIIRQKDLIIPHPRMHERLFVLECLNEIAPDAIYPITRESIKQLYNTALKTTC